MQGLLYTTNQVLSQALSIYFAQSEIKLYDFGDLTELDHQLTELAASFIILDADSWVLNETQRAHFLTCGLPLFCLGQQQEMGHFVPKPCNPRNLLHQITQQVS